MRVSELSGMQLDWAVAKAIGDYRPVPVPKYSTDWAQGGPIIERELIGVEPWGYPRQWVVQIYNEAGRVLFREYGPTPLIAAMRCYVASKLGDEIEVPDEIMED